MAECIVIHLVYLTSGENASIYNEYVHAVRLKNRL
ncbi:hypothetical protein Xbed_00043 [Xenorhabdus beddingii]|uniref:Uncharacterized protein n=1 Tax=Xenorhabdus beddingii TaxID=40578 RepID=A0A1Y2SRM9_9GAMM|nr:hypothetical protein Xbed_00043 [Xenorhabdus beddingii]